MMNIYDAIYLLSSIFETYTIYKFMGIFFERDETDKNLELMAYISYFLIIGSIHRISGVQIVNVLSNLVFFFLMTGLYSASLKLRITATVYIYAILISVETITINIFSLMDINKHVYLIDIELILSLIMSKILFFMVALAISNFKMLKSGIEITPLHWVAVIGIPLGTLFSTFILMPESNIGKHVQIVISIAVLFLINFFVFYLYDVLLRFYEEKMEKNLLKQQNNAYIKQLKMIGESQENIKLMRHDMKLHISTLQGLIEKGDSDSALEYIQNVYNFANFTNEYAKSGNVELDSILNYKIYEAKKKGIEVDLDLSAPKKFNFQPMDIVIIIGNLLDNAIEAASKLSENKDIEISVEFNRNILYISVANYFDGNLISVGKELKTAHKDKKNHGLGLQSVKRSLEKYHCAMSINHTDKYFCVDLLLYNPTAQISF